MQRKRLRMLCQWFLVQLSVTLATFVLVVMVACFNSWDHFFIYFFQSIPTVVFTFTVCLGLRLCFRFKWFGLGFRFESWKCLGSWHPHDLVHG